MLERLSWKRLVLELLLCCLPAFILAGCIFWLPALVFAGIGNRTAYLAFLEFIAPFMVAVGGSQYDPATGAW